MSDWGFARTSSVDVTITIEGDGASWGAVGQDIHSGAAGFTYSSTYPVNGVSAGSVQLRSATGLRPTVATVKITDVGDAIDVDGLAYALVAGGVTLSQVCDFTVFVPGSHLCRATTSDQTDACEAAAAAPAAWSAVGSGPSPCHSWRWCACSDRRGVRRRRHPNRRATELDDGVDPTPPTPRTPPSSVPEGIWHITKFAKRLAAANQVDEAAAGVATEQCLKLVTLAYTGVDPYGKCSAEPIFMSGQWDVPGSDEPRP